MNIFEIIVIITIFLHIIALAIILLFIVPLQIKEARVKNGLAKLRIQLLIYGLNVIILSVISIFALGLRFIIQNTEILRWTTTLLVLSHGIGFLGLAIGGYFIYHQQYNEDSKEIHSQIARLGMERTLDLTKKAKRSKK